MLQSGSLLDDAKKSITEKDLGYAKRALARLPLIRYLPILKKATKFLSLKTALEKSYQDLQEGKHKLQVELEPYTTFVQETERDLKDLLATRQQASTKIEGYRLQQQTLQSEHSALEQQLAKTENGTSAYFTTEGELMNNEQQKRSLDRDIIEQKRTVIATNGAIDALRGWVSIVHNYVTAGIDYTTGVETQMKILEPYLQKEAQLVQLAQTLEDAIERYQTAQRVHNTVMLAIAERGKALQDIMAEVMGGHFFLPQVIDAVVNVSREGRELQAAHQQKLLASSVGELSECYQLLGVLESASIEQVSSAYRQLSAQHDPKTGLATGDPITYLGLQAAYQRITEAQRLLPPAPAEEKKV